MLKCLLCEKIIKDDSNANLAKHLRIHSMNSEQYILKFKYNNIHPLCECGCGNETKFTAHGYFDFCRFLKNHHIRYNNKFNNVSKLAHVKEKISKLKKQWHKDNPVVGWNKGLTKETDLRIKNYAEKITGNKHPQWKGGTSSLVQCLRSSLSLYKFWKLPILQRDEFKCVKCLSKNKLNIHHNKQKMHEIIKICLPKDKHELSYEEKKEIINKIVQYHIDNNVSGITLCKECHKKEHN